MLLFKRNTKIRGAVATGVPNAFINKMKALKQRIAAYLQTKSELLSAKAKKYVLIFFCLLFGGSSLAIIIHASLTKEKTISVLKISKPSHATQDVESLLKPDSMITRREYERVLQFKNYLLHLKNDSAGAKRYDSIIQTRPKLLDSITLFEKMYLSQ